MKNSILLIFLLACRFMSSAQTPQPYVANTGWGSSWMRGLFNQALHLPQKVRNDSVKVGFRHKGALAIDTVNDYLMYSNDGWTYNKRVADSNYVASNFWKKDGNSFGSNSSIGTLDNFTFALIMNGAAKITYGATSAQMLNSYILGWSGRTQVYAPSDGNLVLTAAAGSGFTGLWLGGQASNNVGIVLSGGVAQLKKGDNSGFAELNVVGLGVATGGSIYPLAGATAGQFIMNSTGIKAISNVANASTRFVIENQASGSTAFLTEWVDVGTSVLKISRDGRITSSGSVFGNRFGPRRNTTSSGTYNLLSTDGALECNTAANSITVNLQNMTAGEEAYFEKTSPNNMLTLTPVSGTINGAASVTASQNGAGILVSYDGTNYHIRSTNGRWPLSFPLQDRLLMSKEMYFVEGGALSLYRQSIITTQYGYKSHLGISNNNSLLYPTVRYMYDDLSIQASEVTNGDTLKVFQHFDVDKKLYYRNVAIQKRSLASLSGKASQATVIGNSITDFDLLPAIAAPLTAWGTTMSWKGLRSDGGIANEGRSSWEYAILIGLRTKFNTTIYKPSATSAGDLDLNPFIKVATPTDLSTHPTWCFENTPSVTGGVTGKDVELNYTQSQAAGGYSGSYYIFDYAGYNATNLAAGIDTSQPFIAVCNLGFNDLNHNAYSQTSIDNALLGIEIFVTKMNEFKHTAHVVICPILTINKANYWESFVPYMEKASKKVDALRASLGIDVRCFYPQQHMDRVVGFEYQDNVQNISADNDTKVAEQNDELHPGGIGKKQLGYPISCMMGNLMP